MKGTYGSLAVTGAGLVAVNQLIAPLPVWVWWAFGAIVLTRLVVARRYA